MYIIIDKLSSLTPNSVFVPCIAIDPGPRKVEAPAYMTAILGELNIVIPLSEVAS